MSVKIGHASIDENGKATGGKPGDQTGKEVCTRNWWDKGWTVLLRPAAEYAEKIAKACEAACANDNIGYDQSGRNTAHMAAQKVGYDLSKVEKSETDCSALVVLCCIAAGIKSLEYTGNAPTTRTMRSALKATNKFTVLTDSRYLRSDQYLKRGDILVCEGSHTVVVLSDGAKVEKDETAADLKDKDIRKVTASSLNARIIPQGSKLFVLDGGESVNVVETKNGWCKIEAWVSASYLVK